MRWFLISLAIGLAASDKLDRTYLPPPGAQFSGGILGSHDAPLEPPHHTPSGPGPIVGGQGSQSNFGINGEPVHFGDKIPKVPVTTTSYAFSQTTTYPPGEGIETSVLPINPVTGLPIGLEQENFPYGTSQGQGPNFGTNIQPGFGPQGSTSAPVNFDSPRDQFANQPLGQYTVQNVITPGGAPQIPGSEYPDQNQIQYPGGQANTEQQGFLPNDAPDNQRFDQYPGQNIVNPGGVVQIPGSNQGLGQYPAGQTVTGQQGLVPSTGSPINLQPSGNPQGVNYDGSQELIPQGTYTGQPINNQNLDGTPPIQTSYQNQEPINVGGILSQYPNENQNYGPSVPTGSENVYQPGSTPSSIPSSYNSGVSTTTPYPVVPSPTSGYSSDGPVYRPERPQAAADRNAVILNYENVRTPNGYSYSFDTSNGIHADESGFVDNGTKAQGSYSYIGDDGKVYSVIYTADENGFQPHGDHLPTPPPIPEAIQRVIEQAARDKAAGIVHDGSYDEAKYGDKQYQGTANRRRPQNQDTDVFGNEKFNGAQDYLIKPVAGIKDGDYNEGIAQNLFNNNLPVTGTRKSSSNQLPARRPSNEATGGNNYQKVSEGNRRVSDDGVTPIEDYDENDLPIQDGINQLDQYGTKTQESSAGRPMSNGADLPFTGIEDTNQNNASGSKNRRPSGRRPVPGGVKDQMENKYPGSNVDVGAANYSGTERDKFYSNNGQDIDSVSPNISNGPGEKINTNFDSITGAPVIGNRKAMLRQKVKENRRPESTGNGYTQNKNGRPQGESFTQETTETPFFSDYLKNAIANQQETKQDSTGYHYMPPNAKFEQNTFPTRFSSQEAPSTQPDQRRTEYIEGMTRKPFMTPNVYNQNNKNNQATPNRYNQNDSNSQSTTRRPFTTIGVTSPIDNSYTDYDDGNNYATNQDIGVDRIESTKNPVDNRVTSRPYPTTYTTSSPQNVPGGQRMRVNQKGAIIPGRRTENSGTVSPGYTYGSTTQMPSHNSRFGSTEIPRRMKPQQRRPSTTAPDSTTAVVTQSPAGTGQSDYKYQTTRPVSRYTDTNVGSGYPTTGSYPGLRSMTTTPGVSTPQDFYTSTYGPQSYPSTTSVPPTTGYIQDSGSQTPSGTPESLRPSQDQSFHTGYHYEPPKSGSFTPDNTGFFKPAGNSEVFPNSPPGTYQTTYQQGRDGFPSTTLGPITPERQGTFIPSQPGTFAPETSPTGTYQGSYQNRPSTPDYAATIRSSTPGGKPVFRYPGSPGVQETTGYEYEPSRPTYSTTDSPSTIGTTPGSFIPSEITGPSQDYSTNYRPGLQTTKDTFVGGPVDGFGRPITTEQGGSYPGFEHPTQVTTRPGIIKGPIFGGTDQSTTYPDGFDKTRVIGEDFSGPKQPQRYDPITGYHYK